MNEKELMREYKIRKSIIKQRLKEFKLIRGDDIFYELCFCLMTPQSKAKSCDIVARELRQKRFLHNPFDPVNHLKRRTRFHNNKSKYLLEAHGKCGSVMDIIRTEKDPILLREWLVKNIKGLGYKEASHFLRNIGFENLAILDRHILKNLANLGVIQMPKTLTKKHYLAIEQQFLSFSKNIGIPMDELDLLFWSMQTGEVFK